MWRVCAPGATPGDAQVRHLAREMEHGGRGLGGGVVVLDGFGCGREGDGAALVVEKRLCLVAELERAVLARADDEAVGAELDEVRRFLGGDDVRGACAVRRPPRPA